MMPTAAPSPLTAPPDQPQAERFPVAPSPGAATNQPANEEKQSLASQLQSAVVSLRKDLEFTRQILHGDPYYIIRDPISFQTRAISIEDYEILVALTSSRPIGEVFKQLVDRQVLTQDREEDFYRFLLSLNQRGLLHLPITNGKALYDRFNAKRKAEKASWPMQFFSFQLPLFNPNRFLDRTIWYFSPLFSKWFVLIWAIAGCMAIATLLQNWNEFQDPLGDLLVTKNVLLLFGLVCVLKAWHELGHAYACKHYGGQVPEIGATFIMFTPCAYVDASAAWGFPNRWQRIVVNLGGMYFESLVAIVAVFTWSLTQESLLHSVAHYAIVVSTLTTILFNANPLMRCDGYYVVSDWFNIPNLRQVSQSALENLFQRWFLGIPTPRVGKSRSGDVALASFGIASAIYRVSLTLGIVGVICMKMPTMGLLIGLFYFFATTIPSLLKLVSSVKSLSGRPVRIRLLAVAATLVLVVGALFLIPLSSALDLPGVIVRQNEEIIRCQQAGFLDELLVQSGHSVEKNGPIARLVNPDISNRYASIKSTHDKLQLRVATLVGLNSDEAILAKQRFEQADEDYRELQRVSSQLEISSPIAGEVEVLPETASLGRFILAGQPLAKVVSGDWVVRALADSEQLLDSNIQVGDQVQVEVVGRPDWRLGGVIAEISPASSKRIDDRALTHLGGGDIPIDPTSGLARQAYYSITVSITAPGVDHWLDGKADFHGGLSTRIQLPNRHATVGKVWLRRLLQFYHRYLKD